MVQCSVNLTGKGTMQVTWRRRGGAVTWLLTPQTPDPEVGVRALLGSPCCVLNQDIFTPQKSTGNTQEAVAPSQQD